MKITIKDDTDPYVIQDRLLDGLNNSRFAFTTKVPTHSSVVISRIRLKESKEYCGNHPAECEVNGIGKPRKANYLEGLDWVEFNDLLNDILDQFSVEANVASSVCIIRQGFKRRVNYEMSRQFSQNQWTKKGDDDDYVNYCGVDAPASSYPYGTPGLYERLV